METMARLSTSPSIHPSTISLLSACTCTCTCHVHVHVHVHVPILSRALTCHVAVKEHAAQLRQYATLHAPRDESHAGRRRCQGLRRRLGVGAAPREREGEGRQLTPLRRA